MKRKPTSMSLRGGVADAAIQPLNKAWVWAGLLRLRCSLAMTMVFLGTTAHAEVTVENQMLQSGLFAKASCKPEGIEGFNECACLADIHTPLIKGLADPAKEKQLNDAFRAAAEKQKCEGAESQSESKDEPASSTYNFEVTYQSAALLGLRNESWSYTGGAHGINAVDGMIIDLQAGKVLTLPDIFGPKENPELNKFIYDALSAEPEGEVFHDAIEGFKGVFVTPTECHKCTVVLAEDGLKVVFQTYAVSSFANGPMEVQIPQSYVTYQTLRDAQANLKPAPAAPAQAPLPDAPLTDAPVSDLPPPATK